MLFEVPPLISLHAFESAARHGSFATAAKELNITQSAISHRIRHLEEHLGYELFERLLRRQGQINQQAQLFKQWLLDQT